MPAQKAELFEWLDKSVAQDGEHCTFYICFGSHFWPPDAEQTQVLFDVLEKTEQRVLLACSADTFQGSGAAEGVEGIVRSSIARMGNRARLEDWAPQLEVLAHPAISFFVSHGGSNSAQEAILTGVPMIMWPGAWDQPFIASQLSAAGVAYELVQPRTGHNIGRRTARGVVVKGTTEAIRAEMEAVFLSASGKDGDEMRARMKALGERVREDCDHGEAKASMIALGHLV